jgi:hypothetical protein
MAKTTGPSCVTQFGLAAVALSLLTMLPARARADLYAAQATVDVGEVRCGAPLKYLFTFVNRGSEPVEIVQVQPSCGCLTPRLAQARLQPKDQGTLLLEVNTLSQASGPHSWPVRIHYQTGAGELELTLQLTGKIITEIIMQPAALTLFTETALEHSLTLTDLRSRPLTITAVHVSSSRLQAHVRDSGQDPQGHLRCTIAVAISADCPPGRYEDILSVCTDDSAYAELHVPITLVKQPRQRVTAAPSLVTFWAEKGQPIPSQIVQVRDRSSEPVIIERVVADDPALECRWAEGPGTNATVKLILDRTRFSGSRFESSIHIHVRKPIAEVLSIPVECTVQGSDQR